MTEFKPRGEKPYEKRNSANTRFQRNESRDSYNTKRSETPNYERKPRFSNEERPYSPRKSYNDREARGEGAFPKKSWNNDSYDRKPYEKKSWNDNNSDRKPYDRSERKPFERKPFENRDFDRKPYDRKPFEKKSFERKPFEKKSWNNDNSDRKPYDRSEHKPFERKPFENRDFDRKPYDRKPFEKKSWGGDSSFERKPYEGKSFDKTFKKFERPDNLAGKRPAWYEGKTGISRRNESSADRENSRENYRPRREFSEQKHHAPKLRMLDVFENKLDDQEFAHAPELRKKEQESEKDEVRLNKFIANAGVCSRREADDLILSGKITINGEVKNTLGTRINPKTDTVLFDGQPLQSQKKVYILLNKPKDTISTKNDPENRKTVYDIIAGACSENVETVGRLDRNTTGVFLFTNDGDLAQKILHPKFNKMKIYHVHLDKNLKADDFEAIAGGVELDDGLVEVDDLQFVGSEKNQVGIQIHSGKNHVVKRIFEHFGYTVEKLDRVYFAGLTKKNLPRGKWRFLSRKEVEVLKQGSYE
ncbi:MAG: pseudouridine synthase [Bacteroidales bacterium]|jgi:23S rRNA pseudouridine2605 synthase|nr:pseudouridine synthase [Bacteroidales bacterium]